MILRKKTMVRAEWRGIEASSFCDARFDFFGYRGCAGLLRMDRVDAPFAVSSFGSKLFVTGKGYTWLQFAPEGEHFWATVMFDERGELFEYYFDITLMNRALPGGRSWFIDLLLDVVMRPGGDMEVLDMDELDAARDAGELPPGAYQTAICALDRLTRAFSGKEAALRQECQRLRSELLALLP